MVCARNVLGMVFTLRPSRATVTMDGRGNTATKPFILIPPRGNDFMFQTCQYCVYGFVLGNVAVLLGIAILMLFSVEGIIARAVGG